MLIVNNLELRRVNVSFYEDLRRCTQFRGSVFQTPWIFPVQHLIFSLNVKSCLMLSNKSSPQNSSRLTKTQALSSHFSSIDAQHALWKLEWRGEGRAGELPEEADLLAYGTHWTTLQSSMNMALTMTPCTALSLAGSENDFLAHQNWICLSRRTQVNKQSKTNIHTQTHIILSSMFKTWLPICYFLKENITFTHTRIFLIA